MNEIHKVSICLSDIPKERITKAANGKSYTTIVTAEKKETDQYGKNATAYLEQTKEERDNRTPKIYIGSGWVTKFNEQNGPAQQKQQYDSGQMDSNGDLPF